MPVAKSNRQERREQARTDQPFDGMQHYVNLHERSAPMAFVGRDDILDDLLAAVKTTAITEDAKGMTRVVQGVPGAGKTAICDEFIRRHQNEEIAWVDKAGGKHRAALFCVSLDPDALTAPYLHDGSAATLRDAVDAMFEFQLGREAPDEDKEAIVAFIETLAGESGELSP